VLEHYGYPISFSAKGERTRKVIMFAVHGAGYFAGNMETYTTP